MKRQILTKVVTVEVRGGRHGYIKLGQIGIKIDEVMYLVNWTLTSSIFYNVYYMIGMKIFCFQNGLV
jgi:hypothetical protein